MATEAQISWHAPTHIHRERKNDWYWAVGIVTLAIAAVCFMFGQMITGLFVVIAVITLVLHASRPPETIYHEINDRGIVHGDVFYAFTNLESFWIPHDPSEKKILLKSRRMFSPLLVIHIEETDPEEVRKVLLKYITEAEHREPTLKKFLEWVGF